MNKEDYIINGISLESIRNRYEVIVIRLMKKFVFQFPNFDSCQTCLEDVYALALSRIPSVYLKNENLIFEDDETIGENIEEIVKYAIFQVSSNPKHGKIQSKS